MSQQVHMHGVSTRPIAQGDLVVFRMPVRLQPNEELVVHVEVLEFTDDPKADNRHIMMPISVRPGDAKKRLGTRRQGDLEHNHQKSAPCTPSCPAHDGR